MKNVNINTSKSKTLGLLLAALLPTGAALADDDWGHRHSRSNVEVGGTVVVTKEIPGGVITVGATIGNPRPVVVEHRKVVVVEKQHCPPREVTIIREAPVRRVIVREEPRTKVVIIKKVGKHGRVIEKRIITKERGRGHGRHHGHHDRDDHGHGYHDRDDRGHRHDVSYQTQDDDGSYSYYRDANQVSEMRSGRDGNYQYYEDANQVSIQDNRGGQNKHVYVRK